MKLLKRPSARIVRWLCLAAVCVAALFVLVQPAPSSVVVDGLQFGEPAFDPPAALIGSVPEASFRVPFHNKSGKPLKFRNITSSCSCLQCEPVQRQIAAGATGELAGKIRVPIQGREQVGGARMIVDLEAEDGTLSSSPLGIFLPVRPAIDNSAVRISLKGDGSARSADVEFTQFELKDLEMFEPRIEVAGNFTAKRQGEFGPVESDGPFQRRTFRVHFASIEATVPDGRGGAVTLFGGRNGAPLAIPVDWMDSHQIVVRPSAVVLNPDQPSASVAVSAAAGGACRIVSATAEKSDLVATSPSHSEQGAELKVALRARPDVSVVSKVQLQVEQGGRTFPATLSVLYVPRGKNQKVGERP